MSFKITYDTIGSRVQMSIDPALLSGRDQINLYIKLSELLGITDKLDANAQKVIEERFEVNWNKS